MYNISEFNSSEVDGSSTTTSSSPIIIDDPEENRQSLSYLVVPFCSLVIIAVLTIAVISLIKRKRRIDRLRHHLMPFYNFAPGEEEDWETELLDSEDETQTRRGYSTFSYSEPLRPEGF